MSTIHKGTFLVPGKLDLLAGWLPRQPWYRDTGQAPALTRTGGFRLDDPAGEVGIEFALVSENAGGEETTYSVPMTHRGSPLEGAEDGLIGTAEHGVLGRRWCYDAAHDPVAVATLLDFLCGRAEAHSPSQSDTLDPSVGRHWVAPDKPVVTGRPHVSHDLAGRTTVVAAPDLALDLVRVLQAGPDGVTDDLIGSVTADWTRADGSTARGPVVTVRALQQ